MAATAAHHTWNDNLSSPTSSLLLLPDSRTTLRRLEYDQGPSIVSERITSELSNADLVIADLTELSPDGYFELGFRLSSDLPLVFIAETGNKVPFEVAEARLVTYSLNNFSQDSVEQLFRAILDALDHRLHTMERVFGVPPKSPRERILDLATRIEETAEVVRLLRVNSLGDAVNDLLKIADEIKNVPEVQTVSALREAAAKSLAVLARIFDQLASVRGARIAISGAVAIIVGGSGWPAVTALGLGLAYWEGKETFLKALDSIRGKSPSEKSSGRGKK